MGFEDSSEWRTSEVLFDSLAQLWTSEPSPDADNYAHWVAELKNLTSDPSFYLYAAYYLGQEAPDDTRNATGNIEEVSQYQRRTRLLLESAQEYGAEPFEVLLTSWTLLSRENLEHEWEQLLNNPGNFSQEDLTQLKSFFQLE